MVGVTGPADTAAKGEALMRGMVAANTVASKNQYLQILIEYLTCYL